MLLCAIEIFRDACYCNRRVMGTKELTQLKEVQQTRLISLKHARPPSKLREPKVLFKVSLRQPGMAKQMLENSPTCLRYSPPWTRQYGGSTYKYPVD